MQGTFVTGDIFFQAEDGIRDAQVARGLGDVYNRQQLALALRRVGVPFDLHIYQKGSHGLGLGTRDWNPERRHPWTRDCVFWLRAQGFARPAD